jgi:hypothetical protein
MSFGFLPRTDDALLAWSANFSALITATPTAYGLTAALASSYAAVHTTFATALGACDPGQRSKTTVAAKNEARTNLKIQARLLANLVEGTSTVTDAQKVELGLNVRKPPTPTPVPTTPPVLEVISVSAWTVKIKLREQGGTGRRGKPVGVAGASFFSYVGGEPPTDLAQWKFEGNTGRTSFDVAFTSTLPAGTRVWLTAFWFNGRKISGPICNPVGINLQGGSVALAA